MYCSIKDIHIWGLMMAQLGPKHVAKWILHKGYRCVRRKKLNFVLTVSSLSILICFRWHVQLDFNHTMFFCLQIHVISNLTSSITVFISFLYMFWATVPIIRRNSCSYGTLGTCYSVWMTVWYAGWNESCISDSHLHRVTNTEHRIDTVVSPDDGHMVAQNM